MRDTVAVVVTYNRKELLRGCLRCLREQKSPCDILVVDNASTDGTEEMLRPMIDAGEIRYHNTGENLGGAGGFSEGRRSGRTRFSGFFLRTGGFRETTASFPAPHIFKKPMNSAA